MKDVSSFILSIFAGTIVVVFLIMTFFLADHQKDEIVGIVIARDVQTLQEIFERIHETCVISSFDYQKNPINFLNVESFTSSEIGPMNLVYPDRWEGPYVKDNLNIQSIEYQIIKTDYGYFIVPGEGVELPNSKVIGKDIIFTETSDVIQMMGDEEVLRYKNSSLAAPLHMHKQMDKRLAAAIQNLS